MAAQRIDFASQKSFNTPWKKQEIQIESVQAVVEWTHICTGFQVEVICPEVGNKIDTVRQKCYMCKSKIKWRCLNCRFYFLCLQRSLQPATVRLIMIKRRRMWSPQLKSPTLSYTENHAFTRPTRMQFESSFKIAIHRA